MIIILQRARLGAMCILFNLFEWNCMVGSTENFKLLKRFSVQHLKVEVRYQTCGPKLIQ